MGKPFNRKNYAFAVPKGAPYWETITMSILRLQESGELDKIKAKWFEGESACADDDAIGAGKVSNQSLRSPPVEISMHG